MFQLRFRDLKWFLLRKFYASRSILLHYYLHSIWKPKTNTLEGILFLHATDHTNFTFIQVGANDGLINDPLCKLIRRFEWRGVLLEPQVKVFTTYLQPLYKKYPEITLYNYAISNTHENADLYTISFSLARWATGLASFVRSTLQAKIVDGYVDACAKKYGDKAPNNKDAYIDSHSVSCISFNAILDKEQYSKLDLLQIDTEGFDFEVIKMFPFERIMPRIISFEIESLSNTDISLCDLLLKQKGYTLSYIGRDCVAILL